jgi:hypothetical protein
LPMPRRAIQPASLPRGLVAESPDLRLTGRIPIATAPKSVTVSNFPFRVAVQAS